MLTTQSRLGLTGNAIATHSEVAKLLKSNPGLKGHVVGHTDNVGRMDSNMRLSLARADAVVQAMAGIYGIEANRLKA